jgi:hypothetical protein
MNIRHFNAIYVPLIIVGLSLTAVVQAHVVQATFNDMNIGDMRERAGQPAGTGIGFGEDYWSADTSAVVIRERDLTAPVGTHYALTQDDRKPRLAQGQTSSLRQQARKIAVTMDGTVWFSFLVKRVSDRSVAGIGFNRSGYSIGNPNILAVEDKLVIDYAGSGDDVVVPGVFTTGETVLVVGKIEVNAGVAGEDPLTVWINPDVQAMGTPVVQKTNADFVGDGISYLNVISYYNTSGSAGEVDMIFLSNDEDAYKDVTGVDEPSNAYDPNPADGAMGVGTANGYEVDVMLSWKTGKDPNDVLPYNPVIKKHYLFLSPNRNVSSDPNLYYVDEIPVTGVDASYGPVSLNFDGLYLWRVEEGVDDGKGGACPPGDPNNFPGAIWTFETKTSLPIVIDQPEDVLVELNGSAEFAITVSSLTAENYQWYRSDDNAVDTPADDHPVGTNSHTLTLTSVLIADEGYYFCKVTNNTGTTASETAALGVKRLLAHYTLDESDYVDGYYLDKSDGDPITHNAQTQGTTVTFVPGADGTPNGAVVINTQSVANAGTWDPSALSNQFSVAFWVNWNGLNGKYQGTVGKAVDWSNNKWYIRTNETTSSDRLQLFSNPVYGPRTTPLVADGQWQFIVFTYDGTSATVYQDGVYVEAALWTPGEGGTCPIWLGSAESPSAGRLFNGAMDDIRIYNYAISDIEVTQLRYEMTGEAICLVLPDPSLDVSGPAGVPDCKVDFYDVALMAAQWMDCGLYPASYCP